MTPRLLPHGPVAPRTPGRRRPVAPRTPGRRRPVAPRTLGRCRPVAPRTLGRCRPVALLRGAAALAIAWLATPPAAAYALTLAPLPLADLAAAAPTIVRARCIERQSASSSDGGVHSLARFAVIERVKGAAGSEVVVRQLGGRDGERETIVPGAPLSEPGDEALLFLAPGPSGALEVVGIAHGYLPIVAQPGGETLVRVSSRLGPEFAGGGVRPLRALVERLRRLEAAR